MDFGVASNFFFAITSNAAKKICVQVILVLLRVFLKIVIQKWKYWVKEDENFLHQFTPLPTMCEGTFPHLLETPAYYHLHKNLCSLFLSFC